ncbi:MAG: DUF5076 domain-containing protein [Pseudomonadota bacterium]
MTDEAAPLTDLAEIPPPPLAIEEGAVEVLRVWVGSNQAQQSKLKMLWEDPGTWGLLLAGVARDIAGAYERQGKDPQEAFSRLFEVFQSEFLDAVETTDEDGEPAEMPALDAPEQKNS